MSGSSFAPLADLRAGQVRVCVAERTKAMCAGVVSEGFSTLKEAQGSKAVLRRRIIFQPLLIPRPPPPSSLRNHEEVDEISAESSRAA